MANIPPEIDLAVRRRAGYRCEYCGSLQTHYPERFQIDHIVARQHGGATEVENLALACIECNKRKGPNLSSIDPDTQKIVLLFNPRSQRWADHFEWNGPVIVGRTSEGRATVALLDMNRPPRVVVRQALIEEGVFSPNSVDES
jgi:hypothetical protein